MRRIVGFVLVATMATVTAGWLFVGPADAASPLRVTALGDTGTGAPAVQNLNGAIAEGSRGLLGLGDYADPDPVSTWRSIYSPLTSRGHWMALGNHDSLSSYSGLVASGWVQSYSLNGARLVIANSNLRLDVGSSQYNAVRSALCNAPESMRILAVHDPWWLGSGAVHPSWAFPGSPAGMDALVRDCRVALVLASHEHNYQRLVRGNAVYLIVGSGGSPLYPVRGAPSGTVASCACYGRVRLDVQAGFVSGAFVTTGGAVLDSFSRGSAPAPSGGGATFSGSSGNEWWVQVTATGSGIVRVDSHDTGGAWVGLQKQWWGQWAGSYHIEPGHLVQYRATLSSGQVVYSCWYTHPAGVCA